MMMVVMMVVVVVVVLIQAVVVGHGGLSGVLSQVLFFISFCKSFILGKHLITVPPRAISLCI